MKRIGLLSIVFGLLVPSFLLAQVPATISYQGRLDSAGVPIKSPKNLTFAIYAAATGGTALWSEAQANVVFTNGMFSVNLGSVTPFPATLFTSAGERWLGVTLAGATEMTPRFQFTSSPFAMRALNADVIGDNAVTSAKIADGAVATVDLADNAVTTAKIAAGAIATLDLADNSVTSAKIADGSIGAADLAANSVTATQLAAGSVTAAKILDEPGIDMVESSSLTAITTDGANCTVASLSVTAPAAGYVVLTASGSIALNRSSDAQDLVRVKVSDTKNDVTEAVGVQILRLQAGAGAGNFQFPYGVTRVMTVVPGTNWFYLNIWYQVQAGVAYTDAYTFVAQYFPTRY